MSLVSCHPPYLLLSFISILYLTLSASSPSWFLFPPLRYLTVTFPSFPLLVSTPLVSLVSHIALLSSVPPSFPFFLPLSTV